MHFADWTVTEELAPLVNAGAKPWISVISGMESKGDAYVHAGPASAIMTGTGLDHSAGDAGTPQGPSIDVTVSGMIGATTPFKSIETGLYTFLGNGSAYHAISHRGPDAPNEAELDARKVYNRLFGAGSPGEKLGGTTTTVADNTIALRKSRRTPGLRAERWEELRPDVPLADGCITVATLGEGVQRTQLSHSVQDA